MCMGCQCSLQQTLKVVPLFWVPFLRSSGTNWVIKLEMQVVFLSCWLFLISTMCFQAFWDTVTTHFPAFTRLNGQTPSTASAFSANHSAVASSGHHFLFIYLASSFASTTSCFFFFFFTKTSKLKYQQSSWCAGLTHHECKKIKNYVYFNDQRLKQTGFFFHRF